MRRGALSAQSPGTGSTLAGCGRCLLVAPAGDGGSGKLDATDRIPGWPYAGAAAIWGSIAAGHLRGGASYQVSRPAHLVAGFAFLMTLFGSGSYWANPDLSRLSSEWNGLRCWSPVAWPTLGAAVGVHVCRVRRTPHAHLEWNWARVRVGERPSVCSSGCGTLVSIHRSGICLFTGDPTAASTSEDWWHLVSVLDARGWLPLVAAQTAAGGQRWSVCSAPPVSSSSTILPLGVAVIL
jgi:hypothetical protein